MAVYKVPQDVEAEDKLIGPFNFRQFIYLIVVFISIAGAWGLSTLFLPLAIIPLPLILFFGALALPLRKDQPMEAYLTAIVSFYFLKSRRRFWEPDGIDSFVTIIAPKNSEIRRTKDFDHHEAEKRFAYLSSVVDSHGWAVRGQDVGAPANLSSELYKETADATDVMDTETSQAQNLSHMLDTSNAAHREQIASQLQGSPVAVESEGAETPKPVDNSQGYITSDQRDAVVYALGLAEQLEDEKVNGTEVQQSDTTEAGDVTVENTDIPTDEVAIDLAATDTADENADNIQEYSETAEAEEIDLTDSAESEVSISLTDGSSEELAIQNNDSTSMSADIDNSTETTDVNETEINDEEAAINTSVTPPSAATIDLATNRPELTIETISKEAKRLEEKEKLPEDEVFVSLH